MYITTIKNMNILWLIRLTQNTNAINNNFKICKQFSCLFHLSFVLFLYELLTKFFLISTHVFSYYNDDKDATHRIIILHKTQCIFSCLDFGLYVYIYIYTYSISLSLCYLYNLFSDHPENRRNSIYCAQQMIRVLENIGICVFTSQSRAREQRCARETRGKP